MANVYDIRYCLRDGDDFFCRITADSRTQAALAFVRSHPEARIIGLPEMEVPHDEAHRDAEVRHG